MTRARVVALAFLSSAVLLRLFATIPFREEKSRAAAESRRLLQERRASRTRWLDIERRRSALSRSMGANGTQRDPIAVTRQRVLECLEGAQIAGVRLEVRPGQPPAVALVRLSAEGSLGDVVRVLNRLTDDRLVLGQVRLAPSAHGLSVDIEATGLGGGS